MSASDQTLKSLFPAMEENVAEVRMQGKTLYVPKIELENRTVISTGTWLRIAKVQDEELVEGPVVENTASVIQVLKSKRFPADLFTFSDPPQSELRREYKFEWDNWAAIPLTTFEEWWENKLPQESRKNVRRAAKRGVSVHRVPFDDDLVRGIHAIYNETPVRQGRPFWHYGKDVEIVRKENSTYLERSDFLGAFFEGSLIGFIKLVYVNNFALLLQILAAVAHQDKRPMNALLSAAVEHCLKRGTGYLIYGKYVYNGNYSSALTEFKRRNGFEELRYPRYFAPLTAKGGLCLQIGAHRGVSNVVPARVRPLVLRLRKSLYSWRRNRQEASKAEE